MTSRQVTVYGEPKAQPRPRATARGGFARVYNPSTADEWKRMIIDSASDNLGPWLGPVSLEIRFDMPRPKHLRGTNEKPHTVKPDIDNMVKAVMDALTSALWWIDDDQVWELKTSKQYAARGEPSGVWIRATEGEL